MATITVRTVVENDKEFDDFLNAVRAGLKHHQRWSVGQSGIEPDEGDIQLKWVITRLDVWRERQEAE